MSNFTLTDSQLARLRIARDIVAVVSTEIEAPHLIAIEVQNEDCQSVNVSTFEGDLMYSECDDAEITDGDFTIELRHFHDGKSQYIDLPDADEVGT